LTGGTGDTVESILKKDCPYTEKEVCGGKKQPFPYDSRHGDNPCLVCIIGGVIALCLLANSDAAAL
jgi:hypothetical protein